MSFPSRYSSELSTTGMILHSELYTHLGGILSCAKIGVHGSSTIAEFLWGHARGGGVKEGSHSKVFALLRVSWCLLCGVEVWSPASLH